ncbi:1-deoxy-D-xylulose-5-phosphate reductoisomerase [Desulfovibrio sp. OttesenSCG-928-M14]|nr:1-deoxy-D-xylulose-5-phosphate reductoisomerase [Desulfovibrio sp. OttesenSCG-928-M14]
MPHYISALPSLAPDQPRSLALLGSTGSIGRSALDVVRLSPQRFQIMALAGAKNLDLLAAQAAEFRPAFLGLLEEKDLPRLRSMLPTGYQPDIVCGQSGYEALASLPGLDMLLSAQVGAAGLRATFAAAQSGKVIALANKESLVLAGGLIRKACAASGATVLPVDSEHNALFQCLVGSFTQQPKEPSASYRRVTRLILTASGGPFYGAHADELEKVTPELALKHPNWNMGPKVTIDSATLMNKGLELMEAHHLYGLPMNRLDVVVHRESIIHSLVEFEDHSQLAQLGQPDMRVPIAFCLAWPDRIPTGVPALDLPTLASLSFARPDEENFACLALARQAQERAGGAPVVLNAANETAVQAFLEKRIAFTGIPRLVRRCLDAHAAGLFAVHPPASEPASVEAILALDLEVRAKAEEWAGLA